VHPIKNLSELNEEHVGQAITLFVDSFYYIFAKTFTKDKGVLHEFFKNSFDISMIYVYLQDDRVIGFLGLGNAHKRPIVFQKAICQRLFGKFKGAMIYRALFEQSKPVVHGKDEGHIDHLATDAQFRGQGIATQLVQYLCDNFAYRSYTLEVLSKNQNAMRLYQKLGFKYMRGKMGLTTMIAGLGRPILMRLDVSR